MSDARGTTRISELDNLESGNEAFNTLLLEASKLSPLSETTLYQSRKVSLPRIGGYLANEQLHENLLTQNKTVIGAINELKLNSGEGMVLEAGAGPHNSIFGNRWIGYAPSTEQLNAIDDGSFIYTDPITGKTEHLLVGDYWSDNPDPLSDAVKYRIMCFDYYFKRAYKTGTANSLNTHHAVIMPDTCLTNENYYLMDFQYDSRDAMGYRWSLMRGFFDYYKQIEYTDTSNINIQLTIPEWEGDYDFSQFVIKRMRDDNGYNDFSHMIDKTTGKIYISRNDSATIESGTNFYFYYKTNQNLGLTPYHSSFKSGLAEAKAVIYGKFGEQNILTFDLGMLGCSTQFDSTDLSWQIQDTQFNVELPTEQQVFGSSLVDTVHVIENYDKTSINRFGNVNELQSDVIQFPAFALHPDLIYNHQLYRLRNQATVNEYGCLYNGERNVRIYSGANAGSNFNARPIFCLCKGPQEE